jgi:tRNA (mo5U34)-methyltransferase
MTHWYHTIEFPDGSVTPGAFDLRPIVNRLPWPALHGRRCIDVGTYDGFLAFELERRGAREVVAVDIEAHASWDWSAEMRVRGPDFLASVAGEKGRGFEVAKRALGSRVERILLNAYELSPERVGTFDVVVCGSLLLHLRDPVRALEAMRGICSGLLLSADHIDLPLTVLHPCRPVARLGPPELVHWWIPNAAAHRRLLETAGFEVVRATRPYAIPFGAGHPPRRGVRALASGALTRAVAGGVGVPHVAALARPRL